MFIGMWSRVQVCSVETVEVAVGTKEFDQTQKNEGELETLPNENILQILSKYSPKISNKIVKF